MPIFILTCHDHPNSLKLRKKTRDAHLRYLNESDVKLFLGGPLLSAKQEPIGSLLIIEAADEHAANNFAAHDPYAKVGLFQSVEINPYIFVAGTLLEGQS